MSSTNPSSTKRSFFKKPAWSKPTAAGEALDLFSRSKETYTDIVREQEAKRKKKLARRERERRRQSGEPDEHPEKRRRLTNETDDEDNGDSSSGLDDDSDEPDSARKRARVAALQDSDDDDARPPPPPEEEARSPEPFAKRHGKAVTATQRPTVAAPSGPILLSDDDGDTPQPKHSSATQHDGRDDVVVVKETAVEEEAAPSDEEFPELARRARERAKQKALEYGQGNAAASGNNGAASHDHSSAPQSASTEIPKVPPPPDSKVNVFITSRIPNTKPLLVQMRLQQRLRDVRVAWCSKQSFNDDTTHSVFLTWRGIRLFDFTTCKSLGVGIDENGNMVRQGEKDALGEEQRQIHIEATTEAIFEEDRKAREMANEVADDDGHAGSQTRDEPASSQGQVQQIRVVLKGRGYADFKLIVKPTTKVSQIINAFRQARNVDSSKEVFLVFDGDRISAESVVSETEITDLDHIDIHVK